MNSKFIGSAMILVGSIIGAGMLGQPMVSGGAGFTLASILMVVAWVLATVTGLMVLEVNLALPSHSCTFSSMAEQTLGRSGKVITWMIYLFQLYAITWAYIAGGTSNIITTFEPIFHIKIPSEITAVLFTLILGSAVCWSTKATDYFNRNLLSVKGLLLIATIIFILPHVDIYKLLSSPDLAAQSKFLWNAAPVFLTAFCYQFIIPSLRIYIGDDPRPLRTLIITGTTIALVVYMLWLVATLGTVPLTGENSFTSLAQIPGASTSSGPFTQLIILLLNNKWVTISINGFANIALTTSFLGVALGLFDFLADGFKRPDTRFGRLQTAGLTFAPPLLLALYYPKGFITAINYSSIAVAILTIILPALMVYKLRQNPKFKSPYRVKGGNIVIALVLVGGIAFLVFSALASFNLLPVLK